MARYAYRAWDISARLETGLVEADSERVAAHSLQDRGLLITALEERVPGEGGVRQVRRFLRINRPDLVIFTRQLATMIGAGLPIVAALRVLAETTTNRRLGDIVANVRLGIERGGSLSVEIARYPEAFFQFYVNTVRAGEVSGVLDDSLNYLADYLERELDLVSRVRTAAMYPLVVLGFTMLVAVGAIVLIVPIFVNIFAGFKVALPLITVVILRVSTIIRRFWWLGLLLLGGSVAGALVARGTTTGQRILDAVLLKVPIVKQIVWKLAFARFGRALAVVVRTGVPMLEGLTMVAGALGNRVIGDAITAARERMREGQSMADALGRSPLVPRMVVQMVRVGEETGAMEDVLSKVAEFFEREVDNTVRRFASVVEPVLIVAVGGLVALVALAVLMPIWSLISGLPR